jgi:hypothetical protein
MVFTAFHVYGGGTGGWPTAAGPGLPRTSRSTPTTVMRAGSITRSIGSNKTYYIKPSVDYRKAKTDYVRGILGFIIVCGAMSAVIVVTILVGLPEQ